MKFEEKMRQNLPSARSFGHSYLLCCQKKKKKTSLFYVQRDIDKGICIDIDA